MADLGTLALQITADPTNFAAGLSRAAQQGQAFAHAIGNSMRNVNAAMNAIVANPFGAVVMAIGQVIQAAQWLKGAVGDVRAEFQAMVADGIKASEEQRKLMRRTGLDTQTAGGLLSLGAQSGMGAQEMDHALMRFQMRLGEAASGTGMHGAGAALQQLGLNARELAQIPVDQQLGRIGDALRGLTNESERANLTIQILGHRGMELERILERGTAAMATATRQAQEWGLTISAADMEAIKSAQYAQQEARAALDSVRQGLANSLAASMAPAITAANTWITQFVTLAQGPLAEVRRGIRIIGDYAISFVDGFRAAWNQMKPTIDAIVSEIQKCVKEINDLTGSTGDWKDIVAAVGATVATFLVAGLYAVQVAVQQITYLTRLLKAVWDNTTESVGNGFRSIQAVASAITAGLIAMPQATQQAAAAVETGARANWILDSILGMTQQAAAAAHTTQELRALQNQLEAAQLAAQGFSHAEIQIMQNGLSHEIQQQQLELVRMIGLQERANAAVASLRTPWEIAQSAVIDYQTMLLQGLITQEQYSALIDRTAEQLDQQENRASGSRNQLAGIAQAGSAAEVDILNNAVLGQSNSVADRQLTVQLEQRVLQAQMETWQRRIFELLQPGNGVGGVLASLVR